MVKCGRKAFLHWLALLAFIVAIVPVYGQPEPPSSIALAAAGQNSFSLSGVRPGDPFPLNYIEVPYSWSLNNFPAGITVEAWVKRNNASRNESVLCNDWDRSYCLMFLGDHVRFLSNGFGSRMDSVGTVPTGVWTHIAVTYNPITGLRAMYINGLLDSTSIYAGGVGQANGTPLGIGADLANDFIHNYFAGLIDNVRLWQRALSVAEVRANMFRELDPATADSALLAEWRLNGDASDATNRFNGVARGGFFVTDGAIPRDIRIPQRNATLSLDGYCTASEYQGDTQVIVSNGSPEGTPRTTAHLLRTATDLWICFENVTVPTWSGDNWVAVYLDPNLSRHALAQPNDYTLELRSDGSKIARIGDGNGGYTTTSAIATQWDGQYRIFDAGLGQTRTAEYRISLSLLNAKGGVFGLRLAQNWIGGIGDDRIWPALSGWNQPVTWSAATLGSLGPPRTLTGRVVYQPRNDLAQPVGVAGVKVRLIGSDPGGSSAIVGIAASRPDGSFTVVGEDNFTQHTLELDPLSLPKGYIPFKADAYSPGVVIDARTITIGAAGPGAYSNFTFTLKDALPLPADPTAGPYFLIIAPQTVIQAGALTDFVDFKRRLGFEIEVVSIEQAGQGASSNDITLVKNIRNFAISRYQTYGSRFQYLMLIGTNQVLPYAQVEAGVDRDYSQAAPNNNCRKPQATGPGSGWRTDWYYADLTSNWDTNGNGCLGDGIFGDPAAQQRNGYTPDSRNVFNLTVMVGRIPLTDPKAVRRVLANSMEFERQAATFKNRTLSAMSMMDMRGQCWKKNENGQGGSYQVPCGTGTDGAYTGETMRTGFQTAAGFSVARLYENEPATIGGIPTGASGVMTSYEVTQQNLIATLNQGADLLDDRYSYGVVNLVGHGNSNGVIRTYWQGDLFSNNRLDQPSEPFTGQPNGANEVGHTTMLDFDDVTPRYGSAPIYVVAACETGHWANPSNFGAEMLARNNATAWAGGIGVMPYSPGWQQPGQGGMQDISVGVNRRLLVDQMRLGDAVWQTMAEYMAKVKAGQEGGWWAFNYDLFGDPTLSYFGNASGDATLAAWPMLRYNGRGLGYTSLAGPSFPKQLWQYAAPANLSLPVRTSPVVDLWGDVIIAHSFVDRVRGGQLKERWTLNAPAVGAPVITTDNTIYAVDRLGWLYALRSSTERWRLNLGGTPLAGPVVGADGFIAVPLDAGNNNSAVVVVRPDGQLYAVHGIEGQIVGGLTVAANRAYYGTTNTGRVFRLNLFTPTCASGYLRSGCAVYSNPAPAAYTTPPLLYADSIFAGRGDGTVVRLNLNTFAIQSSFTGSGAISSGPTAGPGGQVLVGTENGILYSLSLGLTLRWQANLGTAVRSLPAASADAIYIATGDWLHAYHPHTGELLWVWSLGSGANGGSAAISYGREIYVQTGQGRVIAIGEGWQPKAISIAAAPIKPADPASQPFMRVSWTLAGAGTSSAAGLESAVTGYLLQRRTADGAWEDLAVLPAGTTAWDDTTAQPGVAYSYRLQVLDAAGNDSDFVTTLTDVRSLPQLPAAPTLVSITPLSADSLRLVWSPATTGEQTGYRIEQSSTAAGPFTTAASVLSETTSYTVTGLNADTTYFYRIVALNETGASAPSNTVSGITSAQTLLPPQNVAATQLPDGSVRVTWTGGPAGAQAVIEVNPEGLARYEALGTAPAAGPYTYTPVSPGNNRYRVKFVQGNAESPYSETPLRLATRNYNLLISRVYLPMTLR
ncbi:MAG: C25 family cysteine peptidase [Chloroflexus sp.]|nr:C25 family cysteine peptidase [Chloroflexus sp.]